MYKPRLKRKMGTTEPEPAFLPLDPLLRTYQSPAITELSLSEYSKLKVIERLYREAPVKAESSSEIIRALVTDRGLLFPQTRERSHYPMNHSMRAHKAWQKLYGDAARRMADARQSTLTRMLHFAKQAYNKWAPELAPFLSLEHVQQGIRVLLDGLDGPDLKLAIISDDVGYCKGELIRLDKPLHSEEAGRIMASWLHTVRLQIGTLPPISFDELRGKLPFPTYELYEFFAYILPDCIRAEALYTDCRDRAGEYTAVLDANQEEAWKEQVEDFQTEDLSQWKKALPALQEYLHPDLTRYRGTVRLFGQAYTADIEKIGADLAKSFGQYLLRMEPHFQNRDTVPETAAWLFLTACYGEKNAPLFLDRPLVVWQLLRSPVCRYIYQLENRNWDLSAVVEDACVNFPLPVTPQSLKADGALYRGVLDACEAGCCVRKIPFQREIWQALWLCIRQSVQCLAFQKEDLFSVQYQLRGLLQFRDLLQVRGLPQVRKKGYPVLDQMLSERLDAECAAGYIDLWRGIVNRMIDAPGKGRARPRTRRRRRREFQTAAAAYRHLFQDPVADEEKVWACLAPLCGDLRFNRVHFLPDGEGFKALAKGYNILPREREGTISHIKSEKAEQVRPEIRAIELILTEWTILQCVCEAARRELMEVICRYIEDPNPENRSSV